MENCLKCNIGMKKVSGIIKRIDTQSINEVSTWLNNSLDVGELYRETVHIGSFLCSRCYSKYRLYLSENRVESQQSKPEENPVLSLTSSEASSSQSSTNDPSVSYNFVKEVETVELPINRTVRTNRYCCLCGSVDDITQISFPARLQAYTRMHIYIPKGNRCCSKHLMMKKSRFYDDELRLLQVHSKYSLLEAKEVTCFFENLSARVDSDIIHRIPEALLDEKRLKVFTGLKQDQLNELRNMLTTMRKSENRDVLQALVVFLLKLRSGNSNALVAAILGIESEQRVSDYVKSVLRAFKVDVLSGHFGIRAIPRAKLIAEHTTRIARELHDIGENQLVLIADGTYLKHQKSANNDYQRKSYSGQKKSHLCKPFTVCMPDGFVVDVFGPFEAKLNDAQILKHLLENDEEFQDLLQKNDVFVLDRGFRDAVESLENKGYKVLMPALKGQKAQLTTKESNHSRLVTKIRWPVESVHGVVGQKFKLLHHQMHNKLLEDAGTYAKIGCYLINTYGKRFNSDLDTIDEIIHRMKQDQPEENSLAKQAKDENWSRRTKPFCEIDSSNDLGDFPELTLRDLKILFTGNYQLKQAVSYLAEMFEKHGNLKLLCLEEEPEILKFNVRSRHVTAKTYNCYVHYKSETNGPAGIRRYCCDCPNGNRTIGCCSHVASIIYFLSYGRYQTKILNPAGVLTDLFSFDESIPIIAEDSDDDD